MSKVLKKARSQKGFTLMEMLIVVAIIAILVAIAVPTFSGALTKSQEAADVANIRTAYAEYQVDYLTSSDTATWASNLNLNLLDNYTAPTATTPGRYVAEKTGVVYEWTLGSDSYFITTDIE